MAPDDPSETDLPRDPHDPNAALLDEEPDRPTLAGRIGFGVLFALAIVLSIYVIWPFRAPLLLAAVLASVLHGVYAWICRRFRGHNVLAALVTTVGLVVVILGPLAAVVAFATEQVLRGLQFLRDQLGVARVTELRPGALPPRGQHVVEHVLSALHLQRAQLQTYLERASTAAEHAATTVLKSSGRATFHTVILLIAFYFFLVEGSRLVKYLHRVSPLKSRQTADLLDEFRSVSRASIVGTAIAALFQAIAAGIGFAIFGVPHAVFFGLLVLIASFVPVVGTLIVWVPAVVFLWLDGHHGGAIGLGIWCLVLVVGGEHIGKPLTLRFIFHGQEEMHTGLVFLALLGGLEMFGLIGLVLGPLIFAFLLAMLRIYERDVLRLRAAVH